MIETSCFRKYFNYYNILVKVLFIRLDKQLREQVKSNKFLLLIINLKTGNNSFMSVYNNTFHIIVKIYS